MASADLSWFIDSFSPWLSLLSGMKMFPDYLIHSCPNVESAIFPMGIHFLTFIYSLTLKDIYYISIFSNFQENFSPIVCLKIHNPVFVNNIKNLELSSHWKFDSEHFCIHLQGLLWRLLQWSPIICVFLKMSLFCPHSWKTTNVPILDSLSSQHVEDVLLFSSPATAAGLTSVSFLLERRLPVLTNCF